MDEKELMKRAMNLKDSLSLVNSKITIQYSIPISGMENSGVTNDTIENELISIGAGYLRRIKTEKVEEDNMIKFRKTYFLLSPDDFRGAVNDIIRKLPMKTILKIRE